MTKMMPGCVADHHLMYGVTDSSGPKQCELDAILVFDSALFLVEAKAAGLSDSAKRGGRLRLKRELSEILGEAHAQGRRAERYLAATSRPVFTRATDGTTLSIERHDIEDIFLVTLTLEPLAHVSAALHSGGKSSLSADEGLPWVVNLYDLMVIADCVDLPPMFPHYIKRRLRVAEQGFLSAPEELDLFGFYLKEGLYFDGRTDIAPAGLMQLTSYTTEMDDYYLYSQGARTKPAPKPSQQMPDGFRNLIEAIMKTGAKGRVSAAMFLLDLDEDLRTQLIDKIKAAAKRHARDGAYHNVVMSASDDGGWGITYMVGPSADVLDKKLGSRCAVKKTLLKCRRWIGIGDVGRKSFKICAVVSLNDSPLQSGTPTISEKPGIATS